MPLFSLWFARKARKNHSSDEPLFCCYGCAFAFEVLKDSPEGKTISWIKLKLGISVFLAMNVMGFALALHSSSIYPDFYSSLDQSGRALDGLMRYFLLLLSTPVLFLTGVPLAENVISDIRSRRWGIDGFIGISVAAAFMYSVLNTFRGAGPIYYDVAVMVLVFFTLGRYLEAQFKFKASQALEGLLEERQEYAHRLTQEKEEKVPTESLREDDLCMVRAGDVIPVDGFITEGTAVLDTAPMTGEFLPVTKSVGDSVWGGACVSEGFVKMKVTHVLGKSWLARLRHTLEAARQSKASIEYFADRVVLVLTGLTMGLACVALYLGFAQQGLMGGVLRALSVLLIVCPCALGAAIPLAFWKSFESVVSRGILFKDLSRLEVLSKVKAVFFDKTGTLTECEPVIKNTHVAEGVTLEEALQKVVGLARASTHPFALALVQYASEQGFEDDLAGDVKTRIGQGLSGVSKEGVRVYLGSLIFMDAQNVDVPETFKKHQGSCSYVAWNGKVQACFVFDENARSEVGNVVAYLKKENLELKILTGDSGVGARKLSEQLHVPVETGLSPEAKHQIIQDWEKNRGPALVVGEGLNDAPMLAGAGVSLAIGGALQKTQESADFVLPDNDLSRLPWLISTAKQTMGKIKANLFWAFSYNVIALPLAVSGKLNPVVAALAMILSSCIIIVRSLRQSTGGIYSDISSGGLKP